MRGEKSVHSIICEPVRAFKRYSTFLISPLSITMDIVAYLPLRHIDKRNSCILLQVIKVNVAIDVIFSFHGDELLTLGTSSYHL